MTTRPGQLAAGRLALACGGSSPDPALPVLAFAVAFAAVFATYAETFLSMATTWASSGTYGHGFAVLPVVMWLVHRRRRELAATEPGVCWGALPLLGALAGTWMLGRWCGVAVVEQASLLVMVPTVLLLVLGREFLARAAFPAGFALLAVPIGDFLLSPMMSLTAAGAVTLLHWSGIEAHRDGWIIATPAGRFVVAEACSGLRYLIASFATALLFAHLFLRGLRRQVAFIAFAVAIPVLGNVLRAWLLMALAGPAGTRLVTGADHLLYGWLTFVIFTVPVLTAGVLLAGRQPPGVPASTAPAVFAAALARRRLRHGRAAGAALAVLIAGPLGYAALAVPEAGKPVPEAPPALLGAVAAGPAAAPWWLRPGTGWDMRHVAYHGERLSFDLHVFRQGAAPADVGTLRQQLASETVTLASDVEIVAQSGAVSYREMRLEQAGQAFLVGYWFVIGAERTANPITAKLMEIRTIFRGEHEKPALIAVALNMDKLDHPGDSLRSIVAGLQVRHLACTSFEAAMPVADEVVRCRASLVSDTKQGT